MRDAVSIEWVDRETFAYIAGNEKVLVWVDYEPGFFSRGRIIHKDSIKSWVSGGGTELRPVSEPEKALVISAIIESLRLKKRPCRVEK